SPPRGVTMVAPAPPAPLSHASGHPGASRSCCATAPRRAWELFVATAAGQEEELLLEIMAAPGAAKERERFAQQGQVLSLVKHPNAVRVVGAGALDDDRVWLARERFPARTLAERLQDRTQPPLDVRLGWIEQVCCGLDAAHR